MSNLTVKSTEASLYYILNKLLVPSVYFLKFINIEVKSFSTFCSLISSTTKQLTPLASDGDDVGREGVHEAGQVVEVVAVHCLVVARSYLLFEQLNE